MTHEELLPHCVESRYFDIIEDFPRTPTAKVEKYKIRKAGIDAGTWGREAAGWVLRQRRLVHLNKMKRT